MKEIIAKAIAGVAILALSAGTATAADTNVVIRDAGKNTPAQVDPAGKLDVGPAAPGQFFHTDYLGLQSSVGCAAIATAPGGKALNVRQVRINIYGDPAPGPNNNLAVYSDTACNQEVGDMNPPAIGPYTMTFDPGVTSQSGMSVRVTGSLSAEVFVDGFYILAGAAPASSNTIQMTRDRANAQR
ncbi:MAG TPA: hypothetical protein VGG10_13045 [Rhizomicrobium sp.]|jgi:hypothetical protein